jgi:creatinine amidohydrolase/Fe(II)-dependent formamide hydrolase-like protein
MRYVAGTEVPDGATGESSQATYAGFDVKGPALAFRGFPVGMPLSWDELYPEKGGYGNPTLGSAEIGEQLYNRIVDHLSALVETFAGSDVDVRNPAGARAAVG